MIPKIIHYCWFGHNPKPKLTKKCIKSWKKFCPDYQIIEWNEENYDIAKAPLYVRQAYEAKKWAFVTDYVRLQVVYENGGIYLDTDVELIKNLDAFLNYEAYFGLQPDGWVATGLGFGAQKKSGIIKEMMDDYNDISFIMEDGNYDITSCPFRNAHVFSRMEVKTDSVSVLNNIAIFPSEYFSPCSWQDKTLNITASTASIHHYAASWWRESERMYHDRSYRKKVVAKDRIIHLPNIIVRRIIGNAKYEKLKKKFGR